MFGVSFFCFFVADKGLWSNFRALNEFQVCASDVVSFHYYADEAGMRQRISEMQAAAAGRPLVCTEYMARTVGSTFGTSLPLLVDNNIGAVRCCCSLLLVSLLLDHVLILCFSSSISSYQVVVKLLLASSSSVFLK